MLSKPLNRPIRIVLRWQLIATAALTLASASLWGWHGALSAALGGAVNLVAGWVYGWRVSRIGAGTAGDALLTLFRAWGIKVVLIVAGLWLVMKLYENLVPVAFFATFVVTVAIFAAAIAVRDDNNDSRPAGDP
jgi:ATP synthase protein I